LRESSDSPLTLLRYDAEEGGGSGNYFSKVDAYVLLLLQSGALQKLCFKSARFLRDWLDSADERTRREWLPVWRKWAEVWRPYS
jgi:hypothetical protein